MDWAPACPSGSADLLAAARVQTMGPIHSASTSGLYSWQEVLWHVRSAGHVLSRSRATEQVYKAHRRNVRTAGSSLTAGVLAYFRPDEAAAFTPAAFPYALSPEIGHWILWVQPGSYDAWRRHTGPAAEIQYQVRRRYGVAAGDVAFVQNLAGERSIEAVPHFHVFVVNTSVARGGNRSREAASCLTTLTRRDEEGHTRSWSAGDEERLRERDHERRG
jgi:hypothetical protein